MTMCSFLLTRSASKNNEARGHFPKSYINTPVVAFALTLMCMVAFSCGGKPASLEERVKQYWELRIAKKLEQIYEFEAPGVPDKQTYLRKILTAPIVFTACTVRSIQENGNEGMVELQTEYLLPGLSRPVSSSMSEKWTRRNGQWYHHFPSDENGTEAERR